MTRELEKLQQLKDDLQKQLSDPEILKDTQKIKELSIKLGLIEKELKSARKSGAPCSGGQKVIMEIRAGAGGEEAALFAAEIFHMYASFAKRMRWEVIIIDSQATSIGGIKGVILEIKGKDAYQKLRMESGVHRIQRIPETEKSGRIHTSTASVAVLPEAEEEDIEIRPQDIKIDFFRSSGPGGQNVNKVETGVRITHLPTGVVISSQESRSQQQNREHALTFLRTKLLEEKRKKEEEKIARERKEQIGSAERVEKIRTYNFPQDRITDHRIRESWHGIHSIMEGNIDAIIEALAKPRQ